MRDDNTAPKEEGAEKDKALKNEKDKTWDDEDWEDSNAIGVGC